MYTELYQNQMKSAENMDTFSLTPFLKTYLLLPLNITRSASVLSVSLSDFVEVSDIFPVVPILGK